MPHAAPRICPGCGIAHADRRCPRCEPKRKARVEQQRPNAATRGYGLAWRRRRAAILRRDRFCPCGAVATEVDHLVPKARGGTDHPSNLRGLCKPCHSAKTSGEDSWNRR